jgi:hypothetical protein
VGASVGASVGRAQKQIRCLLAVVVALQLMVPTARVLSDAKHAPLLAVRLGVDPQSFESYVEHETPRYIAICNSITVLLT